MCREFLWLSKIKPIASHQAERSHVYMWPTLFGRTIINWWNYNFKHNEERSCRSGMRSETRSSHGPLPTVLSGMDWQSPSVPLLPFLAGTEPSIFILGDEFSEGEPSLALCPERLAADKQSGFTAGPLSPELTLHPEEHPELGNVCRLQSSLRKHWTF